ncbi:ATP-binding cassette domain-containing protein [Paracoccus sp. Ld10]|uniref:ATP-binding cassette domain-containing protein n=1 Tax=Paracoccus sp. Ld10 TaxID=649158 RepID=UPI003867CB06
MSHPIVSVRDLKVHFPVRGGLLGRVTDHVRAVDGVSFDLMPGRTVAIVGESGSGKSTTGYAVMGMQDPTEGQIMIDGRDRAQMSPTEKMATMRRLQIIFQDPASALNPRMTAYDSIVEPLQIHRVGNARERRARVAELLDLVGLPQSSAGKLPREFSGGQKQRVVIARALVLEPQAVICDEAVSALDVSIQSQILNLLLDLQARLGLAYVFISHDLSVVRHIADDILVMQAGKVVEQGQTDAIFQAPRHSYTRQLLAAVPKL